MIIYNIKVAIRNLIRQKSNSVINILGLTLGITCTFLLFLMVHFTFTTDRDQVNYEHLFLLQQKINFDSGEFTVDKSGGATAPALAESYPQILSYTRLGKLGEMLLSYYPEGKEGSSISFIEEGGAAVDSTFFDVFSFDFISGSASKGGAQNRFIYLTERIAKKLFADEDPVGKTVYFQEGLELTVYGVLEDIQSNSTIQFSYLVPFEVEGMIGLPTDQYGGNLYYSYFVLDDPASSDNINETINEFLESKYDETLEVERFLSHIREVFLYGESKASWGIFIFAFAGIGILFVAGINYVNLSTARSIDRAKEVGIRKTGGASRWQLIKQFLFESLLITLMAVSFSVLITELVIPYFNNLFDSNLVIPYKSAAFWVFALLLTLGVGTLAGFYPAFMLSSFQPSLILKNFVGGKSKGSALRKVLVVSQFTITLFFIVFTIFIYRQISYLDTADLGVNKENLIYIPTRGQLWSRYEEIKGELLNESYITKVSTASELPTDVSHGEIDWGKDQESQNTIARMLWCGDDAPELFGLELVHGRFYNKDLQSDLEDGIVVNEEIIKMLNYEGDPIGQRFRLWDHEKTIIGVVKNFTFFPLEIGAKAIILPYRNINQYVFVKTSDGIDPDHLARIEGILKKHNPNYPFEYFVFEDYKNETLVSSNRMIPILFYFSTFGIIISCLGLFGLALFTIEKRTKEIGIRKVFGASITKITLLLSQGFIKLVIIANIIALPLAYIALRAVLKFFVVKVYLSPGIFLGTGLFILLVAWLMVVWQSFKVARKNPASSLRYE